MFYIGIDIAKHNHTCFIASETGEVVRSAFEFDNSNLGFTYLIATIRSLDSDQIKIGFESTGHYAVNLMQFLFKNGFTFTLLNPFLVKRFARSLSVRKTKTDKIDAAIIARFLMAVESKSNTPSSYHIAFLLSLSRHRFRLTKSIAKSKVELVNLLDQAFPEFTKFFSSIYGKTPLNILSRANSLDSISNISYSRFESLRKLSRGRFTFAKLTKLKLAAKTSIGVQYDYLWILIHHVIKRITFLEEERDSVLDSISNFQPLIVSPLMSVPGMSFSSAATIIGELGDVSRFPNFRVVIAYAGLDNSVYQSGNQTKHGKISKRGSKILRTALYQSAQQVIRFSPSFYLYYRDLREKGKHHRLALTCVARKLLRVCYSLIKNNQFFLEQ